MAAIEVGRERRRGGGERRSQIPFRTIGGIDVHHLEAGRGGGHGELGTSADHRPSMVPDHDAEGRARVADGRGRRGVARARRTGDGDAVPEPLVGERGVTRRSDAEGGRSGSGDRDSLWLLGDGRSAGGHHAPAHRQPCRAAEHAVGGGGAVLLVARGNRVAGLGLEERAVVPDLHRRNNEGALPHRESGCGCGGPQVRMRLHLELISREIVGGAPGQTAVVAPLPGHGVLVALRRVWRTADDRGAEHRPGAGGHRDVRWLMTDPELHRRRNGQRAHHDRGSRERAEENIAVDVGVDPIRAEQEGVETQVARRQALVFEAPRPPRVDKQRQLDL